jgi:hypothetical protein
VGTFGPQKTLQRCTVVAVTVLLLVGTATLLVLSQLRSTQANAEARAAADRHAAILTSVSAEIERHVNGAHSLSSYSAASWPGSVDGWLRFVKSALDERYPSIAGTSALIEVVEVVEVVEPANIDQLVERERAMAAPDFELNLLVPPAQDAPHLVLTRAGSTHFSGIRLLGLEVPFVADLLEVDLLALTSTELVPVPDAAASVLPAVFGQQQELQGAVSALDEDFVQTDTILLSPVYEDDRLLAVAIIPIRLGPLLDEALTVTSDDVDVSISLVSERSSFEAERIGNVDHLDPNDSRLIEQEFESGGLRWSLATWPAASYEPPAHAVSNHAVLLGGLAIAMALLRLRITCSIGEAVGISHRRIVSPWFDRSAFAPYRFPPEVILLAVR